ncbi:2-succinyl-6-hydroxy-2,4-cyclohexadiene-1-carboxylate synthase [bioreactor metagenome]|uniref:2-succinyl-6-hydroxy-2, 4-cyclohexadiene-1-carboxylate synthase n=1 Tax=bioreactor metagenome TaxID=1076179 RepID=A0A644YZA5_9ZZZZ
MKQYPVEFLKLSDGETLAYRTCGSGKRNLVLIHGNMSSSVHYQTLMERLEKDFTIYAVDMRGFGDSTYHKPFDTLKELADEIGEFLRLKGIADPVLLGWSTGGGVVMELAADLGDAVRGIILLSSVALQGYPLLRKDETGAPIEGAYLTTREEIAADPVQVAPVLAAYPKNDREFFRAVWNAAIYQNGQPETADYELYLDAILKQRNLLDIDYSLVHFNVTDQPSPVEPGSGRARLITCPVVLVHGESDLVVPVETARQAKEFFGEQAQLHILPGLSHSVVTDDTEALAGIVRQFA